MRLPQSTRLVAVAFVAAIGLATSVLPPSFDQLVAQSDCIVRGTVLSTRCEWRSTEQSRFIVTMVTIRVDEAVVGHAPKTLELEFLGGTIGSRSIRLAGQPEFRAGDEDVLFVTGNGQQACPLVGMMYGRYLVAKNDTGKKLVARNNGVPLTAVAEVRIPMAEGSSVALLERVKQGQGLAVEEFCRAIRESARRQGRTDVAP